MRSTGTRLLSCFCLFCCLFCTIVFTQVHARINYTHAQASPAQRHAQSIQQAWLATLTDDIQSVHLEARLGLGQANPNWQLRNTHVNMLAHMLQSLTEPTSPSAQLLTRTANPTSEYMGLTVNITTKQGHHILLTIANGNIAQNGQSIGPDHGRHLEYWLFSTARIRGDLLLASQVLPIHTFEQCRLLGNQIIATTPRQCLLPGGDILLELNEPLTAAALKITSYDQCLQKGAALIYSFPRRCMVAGGRIYTEPPTYEDPVAQAEHMASNSQTEPAALSTSSLKDLLESTQKNLAPIPSIAPSPTLTPSSTVVTQPGLGFYAVPTQASPTTPNTPAPTTEDNSLADLLKSIPSPASPTTPQPSP